MHFAQVQGITIANNFFHDFFGSDPKKVTHNDYIQFWTTNTNESSTDIVIRGNTFRSGAFQSQVIFFRDQLGDLGKGEMRYRNVHIADNIIHNNNYHGITLASTDGAVIQGNKLFFHPAEGRSSSINVHKSTNVAIRNNIAPRMNIRADNKSIQMNGNILSQSPSQKRR
jgi:parallel beta-helix repeat protein